MDKVYQDIVAKLMPYSPEKIILFGSRAKNTATNDSDIDLCLVMPFENQNRRELLSDLYLNVRCQLPIDFILYTPEKWAENINDSGSFAYIIKQGRVLYG